MDALEKSEVSASTRHIAKFLNSRITINYSDIWLAERHEEAITRVIRYTQTQ